MRIPKYFPPKELVKMEVKNLIAEFHDEYNVSREQINRGLCIEFAEELEARLKADGLRPQYLHSDWFNILHVLPVHAWVKVGGRHYDAETPDGVANWHDLEIFRRDRHNHPKDWMK